MVLVIPAHNSPQNHTLHHEGRVGLSDFGLRRELIRCWCYTSEARYNIHIGSGLLLKLVKYELNDDIIFKAQYFCHLVGNPRFDDF